MLQAILNWFSEWMIESGLKALHDLLRRLLLSPLDKTVSDYNCADIQWYFSLQHENGKSLPWVNAHPSLMCSCPGNALGVNASWMTSLSWWIPSQKHPMILQEPLKKTYWKVVFCQVQVLLSSLFIKKRTSFGFNRNPEQKYNSFSFDIEDLEFSLFSVTGI